ncbi:hypothetical protein KO561_17785 [Radiobacillus kanasensis]|uniref:SE1832 family protein n=1 Tax=Radiobacillus kanasensis TaxID=2844358 RepID=UPI001E50D305|nr:SE1832 family protein [Radiobacillus kanasensis]UFT99014.1 hypothetical protein KO561_17785 [Radiobacillus kanasensis]
MNKNEIEARIREIKSDYIRIQADLEKMGNIGGNTERGEQQLAALEKELAELNKKLDEFD